MKHFIIKKRKKYTIQCRLTAFILCFALCMESSPIRVLAAEEGGSSSAVLQSEEDAAGTEPVSDGEMDPVPGEDIGAEPNEDADAAPDDGTDSEPGEDVDDSEPGEDADAGSLSGNDSDSISENDLTSVSENDLQSVSENSLDAEREAMIREAEDAFARLLAGKDLMALLYHTDTYQTRRMPDKDSESVATLCSGQTLYVNGLTITEEDVWYEVRFWQDGVEGTGYVQSYYLAYSDEDWLAWEDAYLVPILQSGDKYAFSAYGMSSYSMMPYAIDTSDITAFPGAYQSALRSLKNAHPNWTFVPMNTG
ncbi:MAG: hypothetical protein K2P66_08850, partial [Lachnospiraceae bacterium]|nr:hypothetical protein [Lachnospiraceae bacterium]